MTTVFNLVILDESGSMFTVSNATISGCNEVIQSAANSSKKNASNQRQLMSIYAFRSGGSRPSRYIVKNQDPSNIQTITAKDYQPDGCTPLLDAVGSTLSELLTVAQTHEDAVGIITIITDGYENSSRNYTWTQVAKLIAQAKELGWTVNIIGANIDLITLGKELHVDNLMSFKQDHAGTKQMFNNLTGAMEERSQQYACEAAELSPEERKKLRKSKQQGFFGF